MACVASPSCSFSALLNSSTASGLSNDYPGQVEGLVLKCTKKAYRFIRQNLAIHWQKVRWWHSCTWNETCTRARWCLPFQSLRVSQQISSCFSRRAAKIHQQLPNDADIRASEQADNFVRVRETVMAITLQQPITFDQYDICAMAKGRSLDRLKLSMLQSTCQKLELEVPPKPIRRKRVYLDLLEKAVNNCTRH